jgi:hypothetical protein
MEILFTNKTDFDLSHYKPKPASEFLPDWYKKTDSYVEAEGIAPAGNIGIKKPYFTNNSPATIKKCIPVFDAITSGYIMVTPADIYIRKDAGGEFHYQWKLFGDLIGFHPNNQAPLHPANQNQSYAKLNSPWSIKTEKGWSCLFTQPMHHQLPFTILPGIVDTDKYNVEVNFIFTLNDPDFEGMIPAGTPFVQIIPIKRGSWKMKIGNKKDKENALKQHHFVLSKFFDVYKDFFWDRKQYK